LPDRVFFACGACHILAYAFVEQYRPAAAKALWIKPQAGFAGNHIFVAAQDWTFDYHGYSKPRALLDHTWKRAGHFWPGWDATLVELPCDVLISEAKSRTYDGLWLREPEQFLHDALPRGPHLSRSLSRAALRRARLAIREIPFAFQGRPASRSRHHERGRVTDRAGAWGWNGDGYG